MPQRATPTERQRRLGSELRRIRNAAGMSAEFAAGLLGVDRGKISNMESGVRSISADRLRTLAHNCEVTDASYVDALIEMAQPSSTGWWERYRGILPQGFLDLAELEANASRMRTWNTIHIPGLLQTSDYALAIFRAAVPPLPEHEIGLRLAHRAERQDVATDGTRSTYTALIHEAALRMQFGGPEVARAQLSSLLASSERDDMELLVVPFAHGGFPGAGQTVLYAEGPVPQLDTVQVDSSHGPAFLYADGQLGKYRAQLDRLQELALSPERSRDMIREIARQL
ncbi:helix-turn-helix domain-containing protein [Streptomyces sp. SCSIO ZS0520]|uniref:helix-turn-helix domain-containing protein n=1 Tax=Streptomyces sp. SCSIO ZS0520 TaxID=2892996 RepID=UPI0021D92723|nr:helix-turn-helix transcriptional regulator [Streptomyces sp. SCSIO ZS0520]